MHFPDKGMLSQKPKGEKSKTTTSRSHLNALQEAAARVRVRDNDFGSEAPGFGAGTRCRKCGGPVERQLRPVRQLRPHMVARRPSGARRRLPDAAGPAATRSAGRGDELQGGAESSGVVWREITAASTLLAPLRRAGRSHVQAGAFVRSCGAWNPGVGVGVHCSQTSCSSGLRRAGMAVPDAHIVLPSFPSFRRATHAEACCRWVSSALTSMESVEAEARDVEGDIVVRSGVSMYPPSFSSHSSTSNGVCITSTVAVTSTIPAGATITTSSAPSSPLNSHTGAGGVVGGAITGGVALLLLAGLGVWFLRKRARENRLKDEFDGNFDPRRTMAPTLPRLADGEEGDDGVSGRLAGSSVGGGVLTPFMAGAGVGAAHQHQQHGQPPYGEQQYCDPQGSQDYVGGGGYETGSEGGLGSPPVGHENYPGPAMSVGGSSSGGGYPNPVGAKQREAMGMGLGVANPGPNPHPEMSMAGVGGSGGGTPPLPNPHSPGEGPSGVVVHQDGGRVDEMREIPPTYDSNPAVSIGPPLNY
ncbi:hypothetical protein FB451DRAFT_1379178 [Mycena latifolia]|nr:hypothetical protein FB451DRAFT_1379178 [Mycena latifolia]